MAKIQRNRERDRKVLRVLRAMGWRAMRIWEHDLETNSDAVLRRVMGLRLTARRGR